MRAGLALSLLYRPEVMFLDEPTLGLDVTGATTMRRFVAQYAEQTAATVLLTSHYMADVASLCPRLVLIDKGKVQYDGQLDALAAKLSPYKLVRLTAPNADEERLRQAGELVEASNGTWVLRVPRDAVARTTAQLLTELEVVDLSVEEAATRRRHRPRLPGGCRMTAVPQERLVFRPRRLLMLVALRIRMEVLEWSGTWWFLFTLVIQAIVGPLIGLFVWSAVYPADPYVATYYVALLLVTVMTESFEQFTFSEKIYDGTISHDLLRPQPVIVTIDRRPTSRSGPG